MSFPPAPCHTPVMKKTIPKLTSVRILPFRFPPNGIYTYSLNHVPKEICHFLQKSVIDVAVYGKRKLSSSSIPKIPAKPIAISEYPAKS